jgi:hypothetical protein
VAWNRVQTANGTNDSSSATVAATFSTANLTAGTKIIASVSIAASASQAITQVRDGALNTWTQIGFAEATSPNFRASYLFALDTPAGDVGAKPTLTATCNAGGCGLSIVLQEVSGLLAGNTTAMCDGAAVALTGITAATGSPAYSSAAPGEYLVCTYGDWTGSVTPAAVLPAKDGVTNNNSDCAIEYGNSTGGAETTGYTGAPTSGWALVAVAFKLSSSTSGPDYATAAADLGGGSGSWVNTGNADGTPDSSYATWTAP